MKIQEAANYIGVSVNTLKATMRRCDSGTHDCDVYAVLGRRNNEIARLTEEGCTFTSTRHLEVMLVAFIHGNAPYVSPRMWDGQ